MGAQHMLRNKIKLGIVDEQNVLRLSRDALAGSGVVVARVTARAVQPGANGLTGLNVVLDGGDRSPACDVNADAMCDGGGYNNYTVEVVDRMGFDSFTPDSGVLMAKTKDRDAAPFIWTVDANPQDIDTTDFVRPDGTHQKMSIGDYRQLSDALFHAGADSGSEYEYVDQANRLHVYVLDLHRDRDGVLSYTVAVRSLDGAGPHRRGVVAFPSVGIPSGASDWARCTMPILNTGRAAALPPGHPEDVTAYANSDVYRISAAASGVGWTTFVPAPVVSARFGQSVPIQVYAKRPPGTRPGTQVRVTVTSESDPTKKSTATCFVLGRPFAQ
jgi:hypothetical protein